jgi:LPS export ABC transporter protein LptC/lipopolysaccharide transport protein LptA
MRNIRLILLSIFLILLFTEIWIGFPISLETPNEDLMPAENTVVDNAISSGKHMEGVHYVESRSGARDWEMFAKSAEGSESTGDWRLNEVKVQFYNSEKIEFTVSGKTGVIDSKTRDLRIGGGVKLESKNGYRFQTDSVEYNAKSRLIQSPNDVKMVGSSEAGQKGIEINGKALEVSVDEETMRILSGVTATKFLENNRQLQVKSQSVVISSKNKSIRFLKDVAIEMDTMKIEGPEADFQYINSDNFLQNVKVLGGVKVSDMAKYATSEVVNFDPAQNKFIFSGHPRVVQDNDEITGEEIVFIDGGKREQVNKMKANVDK